jgi:hypothetical protein
MSGTLNVSSEQGGNPFVKKNFICNKVGYDKISAGTFPKFEDVTCCGDDSSCGDCVVEDKYCESDENYTETSYTQRTVCDKSTASCVEKNTSKKACCSSCATDPCDPCEPVCEATCDKLVKRYECSKQELLAYSDIITMLNFLKSKLESVQPNLDVRNMSDYIELENVHWLECFVDTLFCVLRKNKAYKVIKVKVCKVKNKASINREYVIEISYCTRKNKVFVTIPLFFRWTQLTNNKSKAYKGVLNYVVLQLNDEIKKFQALATVPFLCC